MPSPFKAQLDDWLINVLDISDAVKSNIIEHEFLDTDGALLESLGNGARVVKFKSFWFGSKSQDLTKHSPTYDEHRNFLEAIADSFKTHTLIHPKYGTLSGKVRNPSIFHDDRKDYCEIDIEFVEDGLRTDVRVLSQIDMANFGAQQYAKILNGQLASTSAALSGAGIGDLATRAIDTAKSISSQVNSVTSKIRNFAKAADKFCTLVDSFATTVTQPALSALSAVNYIGSIPSKIVGTVQRAADRVEALVSAVETTPLQSAQAFNASWSSLVNSVADSAYKSVFVAQASCVGAAKLGSMMATAYAKDETNRAKLARAMTSPSFDPNGRRVGSAATIPDILSITEVERSLYESRSTIEAALLLDRLNQPLKDMAGELVRHVDDIKLRKQQIQSVTIPAMPLHVLCLQLGQPYQQVENLIKINTKYPCPTFVQGDLDIYTTAA